MTPRFKIGLTLLLALGLGVFVFWLTQDDGARHGAGVDLSGDSVDDGTGDAELLADGSDPEAGNKLAPGATGGGRSLVGARTPHGIDLSNPDVRSTELTRILDTRPIDWRAAAKIAALMKEPLPDGARPIILWELRNGRRLQVMHLFRELHDPSFVEDMFDLLDDPEVAKGARKFALEALWQMPGAPTDAVVLRLEGRLSDDLREDNAILFAMAASGGPEAARALVEYVQRSKDPEKIPQHLLQRLDVTKDKEAARILSDALETERSPKALRSFIRMASKHGAREFTEPLIALDRDGIPTEVREQSMHALSQIGDEAAIGYLLEKAQEPGRFGEAALRSVAMISSADPEARKNLSKALEEADDNPRPEKAKESLLLAIGAVGDKNALPAVAAQLSDRSASVQRAAVRAMGRLGPKSEAYVPKLSRLYEQGDDATRIHVAVALGSIGGEQAVADMERMIKDESISPSLLRTLRMGLRNAKSRLPKEGE